jgi:hypothetical protein
MATATGVAPSIAKGRPPRVFAMIIPAVRAMIRSDIGIAFGLSISQSRRLVPALRVGIRSMHSLLNWHGGKRSSGGFLDSFE